MADDLTLNVVLNFKESIFQIIVTKLLPHAHFKPIMLRRTFCSDFFPFFLSLYCTHLVDLHCTGLFHIVTPPEMYDYYLFLRDSQ